MHFLKRGVAHIFRIGLGTITCAVFNYATDCWHIPRFVALGPTSRMVIVVSLKQTARPNCRLCYYPVRRLLYCRMDLSRGQPPTRSKKIKGQTVLEIWLQGHILCGSCIVTLGNLFNTYTHYRSHLRLRQFLLPPNVGLAFHI